MTTAEFFAKEREMHATRRYMESLPKASAPAKWGDTGRINQLGVMLQGCTDNQINGVIEALGITGCHATTLRHVASTS